MVRVSAEVVVPLAASVAVAGAKRQVIYAGRLVQESASESAKPLMLVRVMVVVRVR